MRLNRRTVVLSLVPGLCLGALVLAQEKPKPANAKINALLEPIRKKYKLPALAAAVVNQKGLVVVGAVGVRKDGDTTPVTVDDQFHLGSDTKAMTAWLIGRLVDEGKLKWDDTVGKAFPDVAPLMPPELRRVTLTQLLSHHSGLPANLKDGWHKVPREGSSMDQRKAAMKMIAEEKLEAKPGEKFLYSNMGYTVAGAMAEKATGEPWEEMLEKKLFKPLGMKSTGFGAMGTKGKIDQPWQHTADGKPIEPGPNSDNPPVMGPAGTVHCTLADWSKFIADHIKGARGSKALLTPKAYRMLHTTAYPDAWYTRGGWGGGDKNATAGGLVLAHDGDNTMNHATAWVAPARDLAILVVTNRGGDEAGKACHEVKDELLKIYLPGR